MSKNLKYGIRSRGNLNFARELQSVRVIDIILDPVHPKYHTSEDIGTIFYAKIDTRKGATIPEVLPIAKPLFSFQKYYPLKNEIVLILDGDIIETDNARRRVKYYLPSINIENNPHHNATPWVGHNVEKSKAGTQNYQNASDGNVKNSQNTPLEIDFGNYFLEKDYIRSLRPFEGDNILEGRFGNSIRLGSTTKKQNAWSQNGENSDPIIIIRNGQYDNPTDTTFGPNTENINFDDSSIYLTSNQNIANFVVASKNMQSYIKGADQPYIAPEDQLTEPFETDIEPDDSGGLSEFEKAFAAARGAGLETFIFEGNLYNTKLEGEE